MRGKSILLLIVILVVALGLVLNTSGCAREGVTPTLEQVKLVNVAAPGGTLDTMSRAIAPYLQKYYGATLVMENRPGGHFFLARNYVYQQPADGKTVLLDFSQNVLHERLFPEAVGYEGKFVEAFTPVALYIKGGMDAVTASQASGIRTMDDLVAEAKRRELNVGVLAGSVDHIFYITLEQELGVKFNKIPYEGGGDIAVAVIGGHIDLGNVGYDAAAVDPELLNILALVSLERVSRFPDVPTMTELGYPKVGFPSMFSASVKTGTPVEIMDRFEEAFYKATNDPAYRQWAVDTGREEVITFWSRKEATEFMLDMDRTAGEVVPQLQADMAAWGG